MSDERGRGDLAERGEERYLAALERHGLEDLRPACRAMLRELKGSDERSYRKAVRRYESELLPSVAGGEHDPVVAWTRYGAWLAGRIRPGRAVAVDPDGRAHPLEEAPDFPARHLVLHVPEEWSDGGRIIAVPREPTEYQQATRELLGG